MLEELPGLIEPDWRVPPAVKALATRRLGGVSGGPWQSLNLGLHVNDVPTAVAENRARLRALLPSDPVWLNQVHGNACVEAAAATRAAVADASYTRHAGVVCAVLTADCLPVVLCDRAGTVVGVAHAGWRGLHAGVLEALANAMYPLAQGGLQAWLGAAIGPKAFEVGPDVHAAFVTEFAEAAACFRRGRADRYLADIYALARQRLHHVGIDAVAGGTFCTFTEHESFFSYRRDGLTGRMATCVWLEPTATA